MDEPNELDRMETVDQLAIIALYRRRGIAPCQSEQDFHCPHLQQCSMKARSQGLRFLTGTWPYVGAEYGNARVSGHSSRILFVAMDRGGGWKAAEEPTFAHTQMQFREGAEQCWNLHMGGTSQIMECLLDSEGAESCSHRFALTNAVKCVAATGSQNSGSTEIMKGNCAEHLLSEIECLRPHLVITQGADPAKTVLRQFPTSLVENGIFRGQKDWAKVLQASQFVILTTPHPRRFLYTLGGWSRTCGPLPQFVRGAVKRAGEQVLAMMNGGSRSSSQG